MLLIRKVKGMVKLGFVKLGAIASGSLCELLFDERAERQNFETLTVASGAKITPEKAEEAAKKILDYKPDLVILTSPNAALKGPKKAIEIIHDGKIPLIVISDSPAKKAKEELEEKGIGYIIVEADSMIGARREFLDPTEMALFNADLIRILAITGVFNLIVEEVEKSISSLSSGEVYLPRVTVTTRKALDKSGFTNPYAQAKAYASYEMAKKVADITVKACFVEKDWKKYTLMVASAHELMREAAKLADEAREIEKGNDTVLRKPHFDDGSLMAKTKLIEKPEKI